MKRNYPLWLIFLHLICFPIVLVAQDEDLLTVGPPELDTIHFPVWPGCYSPNLSDQAQYRCTCNEIATLIYPNVNWPPGRLIDSGYIKVTIHVNQDGTLGPFKLFRKTNSWLDAEVLKTMREVVPASGWRPAHLDGQAVQAEFAAWIKYKPEDANAKLVVLTSLEKSEDLREKHEIIHPVRREPVFPDGMSALWRFFKDHVQMPVIAKDEIEGNLLVIQFAVEQDGKVSSPKIIKSVHPKIDEAYLRAFKKMPRWIAGMWGRPVRMQVALPIRINWKSFFP